MLFSRGKTVEFGDKDMHNIERLVIEYFDFIGVMFSPGYHELKEENV